MSTNIIDSLAERPSRPTLRSASAATATPRSLSQPSRHASDDLEPRASPRLATPTARIGDPLRPVRARTPTATTTTATPTLGRDSPVTMSQLQRQLDDTRAQLSRLAHAQELAESNARTTAVQLAADIQIRELRIELELANVARRTPPPTPPALHPPRHVVPIKQFPGGTCSSKTTHYPTTLYCADHGPT